LPGTISRLDPRSAPISEPDYGGNCGYGGETNWENRIANQSVDQRGLSTLELANAGNVEPAL
jgi:hypothetical protein